VDWVFGRAINRSKPNQTKPKCLTKTGLLAGYPDLLLSLPVGTIILIVLAPDANVLLNSSSDVAVYRDIQVSRIQPICLHRTKSGKALLSSYLGKEILFT